MASDRDITFQKYPEALLSEIIENLQRVYLIRKKYKIKVCFIFISFDTPSIFFYIFKPKLSVSNSDRILKR